MIGSNVSVRTKLIVTGVLIATLLFAFNEICAHDFARLSDAATTPNKAARFIVDSNTIYRAWLQEDASAAQYALAMIDNDRRNTAFAQDKWTTVQSARTTVNTAFTNAMQDAETDRERDLLSTLQTELTHYHEAIDTSHDDMDHGRMQNAAHAQSIAIDENLKALTSNFDNLERSANEQTTLERQATSEIASNGLLLLRVLECIGMLITGIILLLLGRDLLSSLKGLTAAAQSISNGDLEVEHLLPAKSNDELGQLASSFRMMVTHQTKMASAAEAIASGDLNVSVHPKSQRDRLGQAFYSMLTGLRDFVGTVSGGANRVDYSAGQIATSNHELKLATVQIAEAIAAIAAGTNNQMKFANDAAKQIQALRTQVSEVSNGARGQEHAVGQVEAALEMLNTALRQTTQHVERVAAAAERAALSALNGGSAVRSTIESISGVREVVIRSTSLVEELGKQSRSIGESVIAINEIADQTNLLALNAAIEAARAGEHGLGFAVVADEVRKLAEHVLTLTKDITGQIATIQHQVNDVVNAMHVGSGEVEHCAALGAQAQDTLRLIADVVRETNDQAHAITGAVSGMTATVDAVANATIIVSNTATDTRGKTEVMQDVALQVASAMEQISALGDSSAAGAQQVSAAAEEQLATVHALVSRTKDLTRLSSELNEGVAHFHVSSI